MIKIKNLKISYENNNIISDADLTFDIGVLCIVGKSGSGKSSILNALTGQISADYSVYKIGDVDLKSMDQNEKSSFVRS